MAKYSLLVLLFFPLFLMELEARVFVGENFSVLPEQEIAEEVVLLTETADIQGKLLKELLVATKELNLKGKVAKDVVAATLSADFQGECTSDIYLFSQNCHLTGKIGGDATIVSSQTRAEKVTIERNLRLVGNDIFWNGGNVKGKAFLWAGKVILGGNFNDVDVYCQSLHFLPKTVIQGNLTYYTRQGLLLPPDLIVKGKVIYQVPALEQWKARLYRTPLKQLLWLGKKGFDFFGLLIPFLLSVWLTPNILSQTTYLVGEKPWRCLIAGFLTTACICLILVLSLITIIAAPFALLGTSFFLPVIYLSRGFPFFYLARKIMVRLKDNRFTWAITVFSGITLFALFTRIPRIGPVVNLVCLFLGFGSVVTGRWQLFRRLRQEGFV